MPEIKPPPHLSVSSIQTFNQCPQKFKFNKIDLIPDKPGKEAVLGNFVHDVLEAFYKLPPEDRNVDSARILSRSVWDEIWSEKVHELIKNPEQLREFRWTAWECIENLWSLEDPESITPLGLETEVNGEVGGVVIKGFVDRFHIGTDSLLPVIADYKTGKAPKPAYEDDKFFQLFVYAKLLSSLGIADVSSVELIYLKGEKPKKLSRPVTDQGINSAIEIIQETKADIDASCASERFEARPSNLCNWCGYKPICPAWK